MKIKLLIKEIIKKVNSSSIPLEDATKHYKYMYIVGIVLFVGSLIFVVYPLLFRGLKVDKYTVFLPLYIFVFTIGDYFQYMKLNKQRIELESSNG